MFPKLIQQLIDEHHYPLLDESQLSDFTKKHPYIVLFFCNDTKLFPESLDVAIILPELIKAFQGVITPAIISRNDETKIQSKYGFVTWPSLVFLKNGQYLGVISRVQNWDEYISQIQKLLKQDPVKPPVKIAVMQN